jgi:hypothetical protein
VPGKSPEVLGCFPILYRWIVCQNLRLASSLIELLRSQGRVILGCVIRQGVWRAWVYPSALVECYLKQHATFGSP